MADDDNLWAVAARQAHAQAAPAAPAGGGKFEMSEEKLDSLVKRLEKLSDKVAKARRSAEPMISVEPPGSDPHSERVAQAMNESGQAYLNSLVNQHKAVEGMHRAMQKALDSYRGVETDNESSVRQVSHDLKGGL